MTEHTPLIAVITGTHREWLRFKREFMDAGGMGTRVDDREFTFQGRRYRWMPRWEKIEGNYMPDQVWRYGSWHDRVAKEPQVYGQMILYCRRNQARIRDVTPDLLIAAVSAAA